MPDFGFLQWGALGILGVVLWWVWKRQEKQDAAMEARLVKRDEFMEKLVTKSQENSDNAQRKFENIAVRAAESNVVLANALEKLGTSLKGVETVQDGLTEGQKGLSEEHAGIRGDIANLKSIE